MSQLDAGSKTPKTVAGAPFAPAADHDDGPERPRRDVPSSEPSTDPGPRSDEPEQEREEESDGA